MAENEEIFGETGRLTARVLISQRCRIFHRIAVTGIAMIFGALIAARALGMPEWLWWPGLIGCAIAWLTIAHIYVMTFKCPWCRVSGLVMQKKSFGLPTSCPFCGKNLDSDIE